MPNEKKSRVQLFRQRELKPDERKLVDDVEAYDCHIIQVRPDNEIPGWSYTIGLFENFGQPEVVVVGLKDDTAHFLLNEVRNLYRDGAVLQEGQRQSELLANVDCEFRPVEKRWLEAGVMGYANWFYGGPVYPVLQCVYPDLKGVFPWEPAFDETWRNRQALLFPNAPQSRVEHDFSAAHDPKSSLYRWKFQEPPHTGVFTTKPVMNGDEPVLMVCHDIEDGAWQFIGTSDGTPENMTYVCLHHVLDLDPTIVELADLPVSWIARRTQVSEPWVREPAPPEEPGK
ncbi:MAG TPA: DUF4262 domain-containing protein [Candidatus Acidoferrales bacterium]|nr:DUF4262 domain-containing protein [Candidatus Acidoferrales bacterium]